MLETPSDGYSLNPPKGPEVKQTDMSSVGAPLHPAMGVAPATAMGVGRSMAMDNGALTGRLDTWR